MYIKGLFTLDVLLARLMLLRLTAHFFTEWVTTQSARFLAITIGTMLIKKQAVKRSNIKWAKRRQV